MQTQLLKTWLTYRTCSTRFGQWSRCPAGRDGSRVRQQVGRVLLGHSKSTHRLTVQRVVRRTGGLGLLGDELSVDVLTGVNHTLVIRRHVGVVHLWKWTVKHD